VSITPIMKQWTLNLEDKYIEEALRKTNRDWLTVNFPADIDPECLTGKDLETVANEAMSIFRIDYEHTGEDPFSNWWEEDQGEETNAHLTFIREGSDLVLLEDDDSLEFFRDPVQITEDEFESKFTMTKNHLEPNASLDGCMYETYGEEVEYIASLANSKRVWTFIEAEDNVYFVTGMHFVNRLGYFVTTEPYTEEYEVLLGNHKGDDMLTDVEPIDLFWGNEKQYILNALDTYKEVRIKEIKQIEASGRTPFFTVNYIDQMTEQLKDKVKELSQTERS